jgi:hypothetical protein
MMKHARLLVAGLAVTVLGLGALTAGRLAGAEDKGDLKGSVQKVADALSKGDMAAAKKDAEEIAKGIEVEDVMNLMGMRKAGAKKAVFGIGKEPGEIKPDGIEAKITNISKKALPAGQLEKESDALTEMGYRVAAIAEVAKIKAPAKDEGAKKKADWLTWADSMKKAADELAEAAKDKKPQEVKTAAAKLNSACNNCHGVFRD